MDIELLRNFLEIARLSGMTKAASSLHISQPTLSVQMKSLEEVLGRKLFRKEGRNLVMTEEGELLERRAADIIGLTDKTLSEFRALSDSLGGDVRIGCAESVLIDHLALAVKKIKKKRPFLRAAISQAETQPSSQAFWNRASSTLPSSSNRRTLTATTPSGFPASIHGAPSFPRTRR